MGSNGKAENLKHLEATVKWLRNSYGLNNVSDEVLEFMQKELKQISPEALKWIRERFHQRFPECPKALQNGIKSLWFDWRRAHPEKCAEDPNLVKGCKNSNCYNGWAIWWYREPAAGQCPVCGEQLIDYRESAVCRSPDHPEQFHRALHSIAVNCADCRRSGNSDAPAHTAQWCLDQGWVRDSMEIREKEREELSGIVAEARLKYTREGRIKARQTMRGVA